jgi:hypothetical protein
MSGEFIVVCALVGFFLWIKGDFRAGGDTRWGKFFVEAKERSKDKPDKGGKLLK